MLIVSKCLAGIPCRYDGKDNLVPEIKALVERAMAICCEHGCTGAILKARSPSCGKGVIYDGSFTGKRVPGSGVFAQMLLDAGVSVMTEEEYLQKRDKHGTA